MHYRIGWIFEIRMFTEPIYCFCVSSCRMYLWDQIEDVFPSSLLLNTFIILVDADRDRKYWRCDLFEHVPSKYHLPAATLLPKRYSLPFRWRYAGSNSKSWAIPNSSHESTLSIKLISLLQPGATTIRCEEAEKKKHQYLPNLDLLRSRKVVHVDANWIAWRNPGNQLLR